MTTPTETPQLPVAAGRDLRPRVEAVGGELAERQSLLLAEIPTRSSGPQSLARLLEITTATASRLLKALGHSDPVRTLHDIPGPNPLRQVVEAARREGAPDQRCEAALESIDRFDALIRAEARSRTSFLAMVSAWLPEARRDFEAKRRQSIFQSTFELEGVACEVEQVTMVVSPGSDPDAYDVVSLKGLLGIDRIRPDAIVRLATLRMSVDGAAADASPRLPLNLDGEPALDGLQGVRLDQFCVAPPAPLRAERFGSLVQYSLGPTGFGRGAKVDLVVGEVNRNELQRRDPQPERPPYFFTIPEMASRRLVFDLVLHEEAFGGQMPELLAYRIGSLGPARAMDPQRELDRREVAETMEDLGTGLGRLRYLEFPRYADLVRTAFDKLAWDPERFRTLRVSIPYPLVGTQVLFAFTGSE